jgi:hypothetical protein
MSDMGSNPAALSVRTVGLSPKTIVAGVLPALATIVGLLISWAVTGELDKQELVLALTGFSTALLSALGAYVADPGDVQIVDEGLERHDLHEANGA